MFVVSRASRASRSPCVLAAVHGPARRLSPSPRPLVWSIHEPRQRVLTPQPPGALTLRAFTERPYSRGEGAPRRRRAAAKGEGETEGSARRDVRESSGLGARPCLRASRRVSLVC